jgi:L-asparaginase
MKITFIQTGGTIDKDYPKTTGGYAFEISEPAVKRILEKLNPSFEYEIISLCKKDSQDITEEDREKIYKTCKELENDKIIITHGTDTLIETAEQLKDVKDKVIIFTGSFKPEKFADSDAPINVGVAIGAVNILKDGIYIAMNGRIYPWDKVKRDSKTGKFIEE